MAKISKDEARELWRDAEADYQSAVDACLTYSEDAGKLTKNAAVTITKARIRADRRMDEYFHRCLGDRSPLA